MFKRILIANRGEIALRIIRCCREMDVETVIVYSTADKDSLAVMAADKAVCIGPAKAAESYLNQDAIIETAILTGCEAVHPGYGFLSENAAFARKCEENNLIFIGPSADIISSMGDKQSARQLMIECGVPVVPGSDGLVATAEEAAHIAERRADLHSGRSTGSSERNRLSGYDQGFCRWRWKRNAQGIQQRRYRKCI